MCFYIRNKDKCHDMYGIMLEDIFDSFANKITCFTEP